MINYIIKKPMLAYKLELEDIKKIKYPVLATPKLDGIRCLKVNGYALSRKFKPIPNHYIRKTIEQEAIDGFDGEIMVKGKTFNEIQSLVMSENGIPDFTYVVFDYCAELYPTEGYSSRMERLSKQPKLPHIEYLFPVMISNEKEFFEFERKCLDEGYEGVCFRAINSQYKFGRSTLREGWLVKFKRFTDSEAVILSMYEMMSNQNEAETDKLGYTKRSSKMEGKVFAGILGGFHVKDIKSGVEFDIGTGEGLDNELRKKIWDNQKDYVGKIVKYKSQKSGEKDAPRFPVFLGFRSIDDMDENIHDKKYNVDERQKLLNFE